MIECPNCFRKGIDTIACPNSLCPLKKSIKEPLNRLENKDGWIHPEDELPPYGIEVLVEYFPRQPVMEITVIGIKRRIEIKDNSLARSMKINEQGFNCEIVAWQYLPCKSKFNIKK